MADDQRFFFLDLTAAGVHGGSQKAGHTDWLELDDWNFSMQQTANPNVKGGRPSQTAASGRFGFTIKHNGPMLFKLASTGTMITAPITFQAERAGTTAGQTQVYFQLVFTNIVVASRAISGDDGDKTEQIDLSFESVNMTYWQIVRGSPGPAITHTYNVKSKAAA
jgi:type VI protein secretion system component Hcp